MVAASQVRIPEKAAKILFERLIGGNNAGDSEALLGAAEGLRELGVSVAINPPRSQTDAVTSEEDEASAA